MPWAKRGWHLDSSLAESTTRHLINNLREKYPTGFCKTALCCPMGTILVSWTVCPTSVRLSAGYLTVAFNQGTWVLRAQEDELQLGESVSQKASPIVGGYIPKVSLSAWEDGHGSVFPQLQADPTGLHWAKIMGSHIWAAFSLSRRKPLVWNHYLNTISYAYCPGALTVPCIV